MIGSAGSWNYNYTVNLDADGTPLTFPTSGTYQEMGFDTRTVAAGTFDVYCISNSFTQDRSALDMFSSFGITLPGGTGVLEGYGEYCYAEGLGLVWEQTKDKSNDEIIMEKELTSYSGL